MPDGCRRNGKIVTDIWFGCKGSYVATYWYDRYDESKRSVGLEPRDLRDWDLRGQYEGLERHLQSWKQSSDNGYESWERTWKSIAMYGGLTESRTSF
jgi:hypothetical protein